jgi:rhomboid protease GluP
MPICSQCGGQLAATASADQNPVCVTCQPQEAVQSSAIAAPQLSVTNIIIALNVIVYVYMVLKGVPAVSPNGFQVLRWGADFAPLTLGGQFWRLLASNYLHFGIMHIAANMWCLWGLGKLTEAFYRPGDYVLLYTFTGLCSSLLTVIWKPSGISAGASGAIFGITGVMLATLQWGKLPIAKQAKEQILKGVFQFAALNLFFGAIQPHVDNAGHIGGLLSGIIVGIVFGGRLDNSAASRRYRRAAWLFLWMLFLLALASAFVMWTGIHVRLSHS